MKHFFTSLFSFFLFLNPALSQSEELEDRIDETTDTFEKFVDTIVDGIETEMDRLVEDRYYSLEYDDERDGQEEVVQDKSNISSDAVTFNGDTEILEADTIQGDLVVKNGTLTVFGTITGDVLVVNGNIQLKSTSRILGNVRAMNGNISKDNGAFVEGYTEQSSNASQRKNRWRRAYRTRYSYTFQPYFWNSENVIDDNFLFRYNRVEGFFFGFGSEKKFYWDGSKAVSGYGSFGYGFGSHKWRVQLGLDRQFATSDETLYELGGEAHSLTDTKDEWIMNLGENNLAALFFREDFRDYFQREGYSLHAARYSKSGDLSTMVDLRYLNDRYTSMFNQAQWAVFGGTTFRGNPLINAGTMKSVTISMGLSTVEKYRYRSEGWNVFARGEYGGNELGGNFNFSQAVFDLRRFQPIADNDQMDLRVRAGALEGTPIVQRIFELGGANTLPAYAFKEFVGNRMILANLEYRMGSDILDEISFWPSSFQLIAFGDVGAVSNVSTRMAVYEGFDAIASAEVKSDYGVAVGWHDGDARLGFAWRTDKQAPVSIFFRLNKAF